MPFEKYLQGQPTHQETAPPDSYTQYNDVASLSSPVQLQIPQFIYGGPPILAPGGGAEVLPTATLNNSWFTNNGFTPRFSNDNPAFSGPNHSSDTTEGPTSYAEAQRNAHAPPAPTYAYSLPLDPLPPTASYQSSSSSYSDTLATSSSPSEASVNSAQPPSFGVLPPAHLSLDAPPSLGLPLYSASGFDLLSILARVANRPNPQIALGPVDLTCSFVVVDVRRHDKPIIYCSPTFCRLTGYSESEVIGRNCRFLQAPNGVVIKGEHRRFTSHDAVALMRKAVIADKECQTRIVNFRKDGTAFTNLVTVIPIAGGEHGLPHEANEVYYHIGFQVDLNEQPNAILQKLRDGTYMVNYASPGPPQSYPTREKKGHSTPQALISRSLRAMLNDPSFVDSIPRSSLDAPPTSTDKSESPDPGQLLNTLLLTATSDFILVLSLKGLFLYVAPAVRRVLGYAPEELVGKSITDYCYPHDIVPLTRELKESSATPGLMVETPHHHNPLSSRPRTVDLLFRARASLGHYVWVECRGRLHVEPGKGRKAIILSGRARGMASMPWSDIVLGGGLNTSIRKTRATSKPEDESVQLHVAETEREFWGSLSKDGIILVAGQGVTSVLKWSVEDTLGQSLMSFLAAGEDHASALLEEALAGMTSRQRHRSEPQSIYCKMRRQDGKSADVHLVLYQPEDSLRREGQLLGTSVSISSVPMLFQIKSMDRLPSNLQASGTLCHESTGNVFEELQVTRGSSWQYELQQLKIRNQALSEEIGLLEAHQLQAEQKSQARANHARQPPPPQPTRNPILDELYDNTCGSYSNSYSSKRGWDTVQ